jgi:ISXO2-like transposase domain/Transposase zinc-ribbon domain
MEPITLQEAILYFADADNCLKYLAARRWKDGAPICPTCGSDKVSFVASRRLWQCKTRHPKAQFSIKVGTIFEDSAIGLDKWLTAMWMVANCKNGISSYEIHRALGITQKTAWFMLQRIRLAMQDDKGGKLGGSGNGVEVDETYIGGKARNMHKDRKARMLGGRGGGMKGKTGVQGMLERDGKIKTKVLESAYESGHSLVRNVKEAVEPGTHIFTDEARAYFGLSAEYVHEFINHAEAYVRGNVHTNGLENFWSLLKRGLGGTYISVEPFHLFRYVDEQAFRYNHRKDMNDGDRFNALCSRIVGKRLTFAEVTGKTGEI